MVWLRNLLLHKESNLETKQLWTKKITCSACVCVLLSWFGSVCVSVCADKLVWKRVSVYVFVCCYAGV